MPHKKDALVGCMLGTMVGDALGLPFEGLSRRWVAAMLGDKSIRHRMVFGRGLVSDDTEHMLMAADAWASEQHSPGTFGHSMAWSLRWWLLALPPATGLATLRACLKLLLGWSYTKSGVNSAGNGPLMRSGILGVLAESEEELLKLVRISARITHTDPRAEHGAIAIAIAAHVASHEMGEATQVSAFEDMIRQYLPEGAIRQCLAEVTQSVAQGETTEGFVQRSGCNNGVSGFVMHTTPAVIHLWLTSSRDFVGGIERAIRLGGDTDSVAAIAGGLLGASGGAEQIPQDWIEGIVDFPISVAHVRNTAAKLTSKTGNTCTRSYQRVLRWPVRMLRNILFFVIVLCHICRRMLPPY